MGGAARVDLGHGVYYRPLVWRPDRALNPQYAHIPDADPDGIIVGHTHDDGSECEGYVPFDNETARLLDTLNPEHARSRWTVVTPDPLTLSPSILQRSGPDMAECLHGFIREGRWVPA